MNSNALIGNAFNRFKQCFIPYLEQKEEKHSFKTSNGNDILYLTKQI